MVRPSDMSVSLSHRRDHPPTQTPYVTYYRLLNIHRVSFCVLLSDAVAGDPLADLRALQIEKKIKGQLHETAKLTG